MSKAGYKGKALRWIGGVFASPPPAPPVPSEGGLRAEFKPDLTDTFFIDSEFGSIRDFAFVENGVEKTFTTACVWDTDTLHVRNVPGQQGIVIATVRWFVYTDFFSVRPRPEQIIYHPVTPYREGYRIVDIVDAEECYEIYLDRLTV